MSHFLNGPWGASSILFTLGMIVIMVTWRTSNQRERDRLWHLSPHSLTLDAALGLSVERLPEAKREEGLGACFIFSLGKAKICWVSPGHLFALSPCCSALPRGKQEWSSRGKWTWTCSHCGDQWTDDYCEWTQKLFVPRDQLAEMSEMKNPKWLEEKLWQSVDPVTAMLAAEEILELISTSKNSDMWHGDVLARRGWENWEKYAEAHRGKIVKKPKIHRGLLSLRVNWNDAGLTFTWNKRLTKATRRELNP